MLTDASETPLPLAECCHQKLIKAIVVCAIALIQYGNRSTGHHICHRSSTSILAGTKIETITGHISFSPRA